MFHVIVGSKSSLVFLDLNLTYYIYVGDLRKAVVASLTVEVRGRGFVCPP